MLRGYAEAKKTVFHEHGKARSCFPINLPFCEENNEYERANLPSRRQRFWKTKK